MAIYVEANKRIELISEIVYVLMAKVAPVLSMFPKSLVCLFIYFTTDMRNEALVLPIPMWFVYNLMISFYFFSNALPHIHSILNWRFPFDSKNPTGYLLAVALEYIGNTLIYCFVADLVALGVAGLLFTLSMVEVAENNFNLLNKTIKRNGTPLEFHQKIRYTIQLHSNAKQFSEIDSIFLRTKKCWTHCIKSVLFSSTDWVENCCTELKHLILALLMWSFISISASMLMIQMDFF